MPASSPWGKTPQQSIQGECAHRGKAAVVTGCIDLLEGRDVDDQLILALGGPPARWVVTGEPSGPPYWLRVWALRGLLWAWDDVALPAVEAALNDDAWRVREMALKVVARHRLEYTLTTVAALQEDPVPRVRGAASRALRRFAASELDAIFGKRVERRDLPQKRERRHGPFRRLPGASSLADLTKRGVSLVPATLSGVGDDVDPLEVLRRWFAAHGANDVGAASRLMDPAARIRVPGQELIGFAGLMRWYAERTAALGDAFRYDLVDLLSGRHHVAAVLALTDGTRSWQQVALYRVEAGLITAVTAYEVAPDELDLAAH